MLPSGHNPRRLDVLPCAPVAHRLSLSMSFGLIDHARPPAPLAQGPEQAGSLAREMMTRGTATAILERVFCLRHLVVPFLTTCHLIATSLTQSAPLCEFLRMVLPFIRCT